MNLKIKRPLATNEAAVNMNIIFRHIFKSYEKGCSVRQNKSKIAGKSKKLTYS